MSAQDQNRQPRGLRIGGQYVESVTPRVEGVVLVDDQQASVLSTAAAPTAVARPVVDARAAMLAGAGFVPARPVIASHDPRDAGDPGLWWDQNFASGEYGAEQGDYPQMPDDFTPSQTGGGSLSGRRRTHRMSYSGGGVSVRMPSVASVKRFAAQSPSATFDMPMSVTYPGGSAQGWVRVTADAGGQWAVEPLGFREGTKAGAYVAEAVSAVLEARRPTRALADTGDLIEAHKNRIDTVGGALLERRPSAWIDGLGYDRRSEMMVMRTNGRVYGYTVPPKVFEQLRDAASPGRTYNRTVRNKAVRVPITQCDSCRRFHNELAEHRCPVVAAERSGTFSLHNRRARLRAAQS
jgi:hypothetical protein